MANFFSNLISKAQIKAGQLLTGIKPEDILTEESKKRAAQKNLFVLPEKKEKKNFFSNISQKITEPFSNITEITKVPEKTIANISAYTASPDETDDRPFETAMQTRARKGIVANNDRSLLGQKVKINGQIYSVEDMMNERYRDEFDKTGKRYFDIFMDTKDEAFNFGRQDLKVELLDKLVPKVTTKNSLVPETIKQFFSLETTKQVLDKVRKKKLGEPVIKLPGKVGDVQSKIADFLAPKNKEDIGVDAASFVSPLGFAGTVGKKAINKLETSTIRELEPKLINKFGETVVKLTNFIKKAQPVREATEELFSKERAIRTARVASAGERVQGEAGLFAQLGQLKGPLPKKTFEAVRKAFNQEEIDSLFNAIERTDTLLPLEKVTSKTGLKKLFDGEVPTRNEIGLLRETFPEELIKEILEKRPLKDKIWQAIGQAFNLPRAIMATLDLSAPLRQGVFLVGRPKQFTPAFAKMFQYAGSEKAYQELTKDIQSRANYKLMRQAKIAFTDLSEALSKREEAFMSNWAEKIPGFGRLARASNRAYSGFLNKLRADVFDDIANKVGKNLSEIELRDLGKFINAATGRGDLGKTLNKAAPALNAMFFSPRLIASRMNLLNPLFYTNLSPIARKEALKSLLSFSGVAGSVLGLAKLGGVDVGVDPRSADFGKIKVGNTRYDILGGFQQYLKLASQLYSGEIVSTTTGRTITLGEGYKPLTRKDILLRFLEGKENPLLSFITSWLQGTTFTGEEFDLPTETINRFIPMVVQDLYEIVKDKGSVGYPMWLPAIFGVGVQTYGKQELVSGESKLGEQTSQVRPVQELAEKIREKIFGKLPLGSSVTSSVEAYYDQLNRLPREEAAKVFDSISKNNPELAKKIATIVKEREKGITVKDKDLKAKGVASGDRALAVKKELDKRNTKEEKATLWEEYVKKGIITKEVARQLTVLLKDNSE